VKIVLLNRIPIEDTLKNHVVNPAYEDHLRQLHFIKNSGLKSGAIASSVGMIPQYYCSRLSMIESICRQFQSGPVNPLVPMIIQSKGGSRQSMGDKKKSLEIR